MRPQWGKLVRHVIYVGISLAIIGHLLGRAFLFTHKVYSGGAYNADNESVLWRTPLVMASLGITMTAGFDLLVMFLRRPVQTQIPITDSPSNA